MFTKLFLLRLIWLLIIPSALIACTPNIETQSPTVEPTMGVIPTLTPVAATYKGAALPTPKQIAGFVGPPSVWLIVGDQAIPPSLAAGGTEQGHFDPAVAIPNIATATLLAKR